jgi:hypothetical protein
MTYPRRPFLRPMLGLLLLLAAASVFAWRTSGLRGGAWQWDFGIYSAASRAWLAGENPYDEPALHARWVRAGEPGAGVEDISWLQSIVPPTTLVMIAPVAAMPRSIAFAAWYCVNVVALAGAAAALLAMTGLRFTTFAAWAMLALVLMLGPVQSGVHAGQPAVLSAACIVMAIWCSAGRRPVAAGVLLAVAASMKLQLAAPFILLAVVRREWRTVAVAAGGFSVIALVGVARLQVAGVDWWADWLDNIRRSATGGGPNDFAPPNPSRDHLLNLQLPLYAITGSRAVAQIAAVALVTVGALAYLIRLRRHDRAPAEDDPRDALLLAAPVAVLTLLPVYHRYYDATILMIPLAWAIAAVAEAGTAVSRRRRAMIVLALIAPFVLPVGWATNLVRRGHVPPSIAEQPWWQIAVMPLQVWLLVALAIVLISAMSASPPGRPGN